MNKKQYSYPLFIGVFVLFSSFGSFYIKEYFFNVPIIWVSLGVVIAFVVKYGKRFILLVSSAFFIGTMLGYLVLYQEEWMISLVYSLVITSSIVLLGMLFRTILFGLGYFNIITPKSVMVHAVSFIIASLVASLLPATILQIYITDQSLFGIYVMFLIQFSLGIFLMGLPIMVSFYYETSFRDVEKVNFYAIGFFLTAMVYALFGIHLVNQGLTSQIYGLSLMLILFASVAILRLRSISVLTIILFINYIHNYDYFIRDDDVFEHIVLQLVIYFSLLSIAITFIKSILYELKNKQEALLTTNRRLEETLDSAFAILQLSERDVFKQNVSSEDYLKSVFQLAVKIFRNFDAASTYIRGEEYVKFIDAVNYDVATLNDYQFSIEDFDWTKDVPSHIVNSYKIVKQSLRERYDNFIGTHNELKETITFRIFIEDDVVGGISFDVFRHSNKHFTKNDYEYIKAFQRTMNRLYETTQLNNKNNLLRDDIVISLIHTLELYDMYTGGHSEEVAHLSKTIAQRMDVPYDEVDNIFWAGIMHDIGKVGVKQEIINKTTRLTEEEFEEVKQHTMHGYHILRKSLALEHIADLVRSHHEWFNGTGYPDQLSGVKIPLGSRIINVCDAVSSMYKKRPYSDGKSIDYIREELIRYKEIQFCPEVVDEMVKFIDEGLLQEFYDRG